MLDPINLYELETESRHHHQERLHEAAQWRLAQLAQQRNNAISKPLTAKPSLFTALLRRLLPLRSVKTAPTKMGKPARPIAQ